MPVTERDSTGDGVGVRSADAENVADPEIDVDCIALFDSNADRKALIVIELNPVPDTLTVAQ